MSNTATKCGRIAKVGARFSQLCRTWDLPHFRAQPPLTLQLSTMQFCAQYRLARYGKAFGVQMRVESPVSWEDKTDTTDFMAAINISWASRQIRTAATPRNL